MIPSSTTAPRWRRLQSMPSEDKTIHLYEGARHELVNETNRDEVIDEIAAFIARVATE